MKLFNISKKICLASKVKIADTFFSRMVGLLNRSSLNAEEALIITHCNSIHMFFMRFPIDAVFADKKNVVVGLVKNIKPFQLSRIYFKANYVVEFPSGIIEQKNISVGDILSLAPAE